MFMDTWTWETSLIDGWELWGKSRPTHRHASGSIYHNHSQKDGGIGKKNKNETVLYGQICDRSAGVHHRGRLGDNWTVGGREHSTGETVWTGNTDGQMDGEENYQTKSIRSAGSLPHHSWESLLFRVTTAVSRFSYTIFRLWRWAEHFPTRRSILIVSSLGHPDRLKCNYANGSGVEGQHGTTLRTLFTLGVMRLKSISSPHFNRCEVDS